MSQRLFLAVFGLFVFLASLKFGNPIVLESIAAFPQGGWDWMLSAWPNPIGLLGASLLLILSLWTGAPFPQLSPRVFWLPCAFLATQLAATLGSVSPQISMDTMSLFVAGVAVYAVGLQWGATEHIRWPLWALVAASGFVALLTIEQYFGGLEETRKMFELYFADQDVPSDYRIKLGGDRPFSTFVYPNSLAGFLVLVLPVLAAMVWGLRRTWEPAAMWLVMAGVVGLILFSLVLSGSKGGFLTLVGTVAVAVVVVRFPWRIKLVLGVALAICAAGFVVRYGPNLKRYAASTAGARVAYWQAGLKIFADHPVLGTGPGTFGAVYPKYKSPTPEDPRLAHNNFLEALSDSGAVGFVAYAALWLWPLALALRRLREANDPLLTGLALGLVAWALHGLIDFDQYIPSLAFLAFLFLGILEARLQPRRKVIAVPVWLKAAATALLLALAVLPVKRLAGQSAMDAAQRLTRNPYAGLHEVERAIRWAPLDGFYHFKAGLIEAGLGRHTALDRIHRARLLDPYRSMYAWQMAEQVHETEGASADYFRTAEEAVLLAPRNPRYRLELAEAYRSAGRPTEAELHGLAHAEIQRALGLSP